MEHISPSLEVLPNEDQKDTFQGRLNTILNTAISVETINHYGNRLLNDLVTLTDDIVTNYLQENNEPTSQTDDALEDEAFAHYGLPNIGDILIQAQEKLNQIDAITSYVQNVARTPEIITPPDPHTPLHGTESGERREPGLVPRLVTLVYILETDFDIPKEDLVIVEGGLAREMRRSEPYYRVQVDDLNRIVYICDEAFNSSYVFDLGRVRESEVTVEQLDFATKDERNQYIANVPGVGKRVLQIPGWRDEMSQLLSNDIPVPEEEKTPQIAPEVRATFPHVSTSELDPMRGYWTDDQGRHWGSLSRLRQDIPLDDRAMNELIENNPEIQNQDIIGLNNRPCIGYCLEELSELPLIKQRLKLAPQPEKEGEWKGFYVDQEGQHWNRVNAIAKKIGTTNKTLQAIINTTNNLHTHTLFKHTVYCYEEIVALPETARFQTELPRINSEGEEKGFYIDEQGLHWGPAQHIADRLRVSIGAVDRYIERDGLQAMKLTGRMNTLLDGYCYEAVAAIPEIATLSARAHDRSNEIN